MVRLTTFVIVALVGLASTGGFSGAARALELEGDWAWEGVEISEPLVDDPLLLKRLQSAVGDTPNSLSTGLTPFRVTFNELADDRNAYIPELLGAEFMVVYVEAGEFILDVKGPGSYLVDPEDHPDTGAAEDTMIEIMRAEISEDGMTVEYFSTDHFVRDEKGQVCVDRCTVLPGVAVQLTPGDRVIAPAGAICVWCLLNTTEYEGKPSGQLFVYPLLRGGRDFSWKQYFDPPGLKAQATPVAKQSAGGAGDEAPVVMVWAFNPAPGCKRGPGA